MENNSAEASSPRPEILAPAGDANCFLAALAAGADAIYLGLKNFSARMEARNFGLGELARLVELAHLENRRVYVAMNNMIKENELDQAWRLLKNLGDHVHVDGLIIQDLAMLDICRQTGFRGIISLSTLANISCPSALKTAARLGANRVILPRELSLDEMRAMGAACPSGLELECFVHGALCYCVSGRCWWSSYMGGKSGLRGRCVQPCRRLYARGKSVVSTNKGAQAKALRYFACQDLELGEIAGMLLTVPRLTSWKIEGRKKGPHYVFYVTTAYRMLRDNPRDSATRKAAAEILKNALGRPGVKARFLPQKKYFPMNPAGQTTSGLLVGKVEASQGGCLLKPRQELLPGDLLRVGVEDERWHATMPVTRFIPRGGSLNLRIPKHKTPKTGTPVLLVDRRDPELLALLSAWKKKLDVFPELPVKPVAGVATLPRPAKRQPRADMVVRPAVPRPLPRHILNAVWLSSRSAELPGAIAVKICFWLPPVIWPENEAQFEKAVSRLWDLGARHFTCNSPWQRSLFPEKLPKDADLLAGPFCNIANPLAIAELARLGFNAAFASPELSSSDLLSLPASSPLPLAMVLAGYWPVGISHFGLNGVNVGEPFRGPKGEVFWAKNYGGETWIYPGWPLDLKENKGELATAGYSFFSFLEERVPENMYQRERPGVFNWDGRLL